MNVVGLKNAQRSWIVSEERVKSMERQQLRWLVKFSAFFATLTASPRGEHTVAV